MDEEMQVLEEQSRYKDLKNRTLSRLADRFLGEALNNPSNNPDKEALEVQATLGSKGEKEAVVMLKQSKMWEKRQEIMKTRVTAEEVTLLVELEAILEKHPDGLKDLDEVSKEFQTRRMRQIGVAEPTIGVANKHVDEVVSLGSGGPIVESIARRHDGVKYTAGGQFLLGLHETTSAVLAGEELRCELDDQEMLEELGLGNIDQNKRQEMIDAWVKVTEIAILQHGHDEFTEKTVDRKIDQEEEIYRMGGNGFLETQMYIKNWRGVTDISVGLDEQHYARLNKWIEGVREKDMGVGMNLASFEKYHREALMRKDGFTNYGSSAAYIASFAPSLLEYEVDMPNVLGVRELLKSERLQSTMALCVVLEADENNRSANWVKIRNALGGDDETGYAADELLAVAAKMKEVYEDGDYETHSSLFSQLAEELRKIELQGVDEEIVSVLQAYKGRAYYVAV